MRIAELQDIPLKSGQPAGAATPSSPPPYAVENPYYGVSNGYVKNYSGQITKDFKHFFHGFLMILDFWCPG